MLFWKFLRFQLMRHWVPIQFTLCCSVVHLQESGGRFDLCEPLHVPVPDGWCDSDVLLVAIVPCSGFHHILLPNYALIMSNLFPSPKPYSWAAMFFPFTRLILVDHFSRSSWMALCSGGWCHSEIWLANVAIHLPIWYTTSRTERDALDWSLAYHPDTLWNLMEHGLQQHRLHMTGQRKGCETCIYFALPICHYHRKWRYVIEKLARVFGY